MQLLTSRFASPIHESARDKLMIADIDRAIARVLWALPPDAE